MEPKGSYKDPNFSNWIWPNAFVPFIINPKVKKIRNDAYKKIIEAINDLNTKTVMNFKYCTYG